MSEVMNERRHERNVIALLLLRPQLIFRKDLVPICFFFFALKHTENFRLLDQFSMSCFVVCELWQSLWSFISFSFTNNNDFWHKDLHFKKKNEKEHNLEQEKGRGNWKIYSVIGYYL